MAPPRIRICTPGSRSGQATPDQCDGRNGAAALWGQYAVRSDAKSQVLCAMWFKPFRLHGGMPRTRVGRGRGVTKAGSWPAKASRPQVSGPTWMVASFDSVGGSQSRVIVVGQTLPQWASIMKWMTRSNPQGQTLFVTVRVVPGGGPPAVVVYLLLGGACLSA